MMMTMTMMMVMMMMMIRRRRRRRRIIRMAVACGGDDVAGSMLHVSSCMLLPMLVIVVDVDGDCAEANVVTSTSVITACTRGSQWVKAG